MFPILPIEIARLELKHDSLTISDGQILDLKFGQVAIILRAWESNSIYLRKLDPFTKNLTFFVVRSVKASMFERTFQLTFVVIAFLHGIACILVNPETLYVLRGLHGQIVFHLFVSLFLFARIRWQWIVTDVNLEYRTDHLHGDRHLSRDCPGLICIRSQGQ